MIQNLITVILTTCNGENYLEEQLNSIILQTHENLEIIICDDASTDQTKTIIEVYKKRDSRVKVIFNDTNIGLHATLSKGLSASTGKYIAISDQDDIWKKNKIEVLLQHIGNKTAVYSNSLLIDKYGKLTGANLFDCINAKKPNIGNKLVNLLFKNCVSGHALLFHRQILSVVLPFYDEVMYDQKLAFASCLLNGLTFYDEPLVFHRIHDTNQNNVNLIKRKNPKSSKQHIKKNTKQHQKRIELKNKIEVVLNTSKIMKERGFIISKKNSTIINDLKSVHISLQSEFDTHFHWKLFLNLLKVYCKHTRNSKFFTIKKCFKLSKKFRKLKTCDKLLTKVT